MTPVTVRMEAVGLNELEEKYYIGLIAKRKREFLEKHLRPSQNEWVLEEMEEYGDEVNTAAYLAFKHGKMTKNEYQETVDAARSEWIILYEKVKEHEEEQEYLARLTGQVSPLD